MESLRNAHYIRVALAKTAKKAIAYKDEAFNEAFWLLMRSVSGSCWSRHQPKVKWYNYVVNAMRQDHAGTSHLYQRCLVAI